MDDQLPPRLNELITLSEEDLIYCYEEGVQVKIYKRLPLAGKDADELKELKHYKKKGSYDSSEYRVSVYLPNIKNVIDYKITLFHELAHAIDDLLFDDRYNEEKIEEIAQATYQTNPQLFDFIKDLYKLSDTTFEK